MATPSPHSPKILTDFNHSSISDLYQLQSAIDNGYKNMAPYPTPTPQANLHKIVKNWMLPVTEFCKKVWIVKTKSLHSDCITTWPPLSTEQTQP